MACKCRGLCFATAFILLFVAILCCALFIFYEFPGSNLSVGALASVVATKGISTVWCRAVAVSTSDGQMLFNASVVPGPVGYDSSIRQENTAEATFEVSKGSYVLLRYYLLPTSVISVKQCATQPNLMSYIFKGKEVDDDCLKLTDERLPWFHNGKDMEDIGFLQKLGHDPCADITLQRFLVKVCKSGKMQPMHARIAVEDFYLIYYRGNPTDDANVTMVLTINRPAIDLSKRIYSCTRVTNCVLPLRWGSNDVVVIQTAMKSLAETEIKWTCVPNYISYGMVFGGVPLITIILLTLFLCFCRRRQAKKRANSAITNEEREPFLCESTDSTNQYVVSKEDERVQSDKFYGTFGQGAVAAATGPIPGPSNPVPSAPPRQPFIEDHIVPPIIGREPPPTYEESVKDDDRQPMKC